MRRRNWRYRASAIRAYLSLARRDANAPTLFEQLPDTLCLGCYIDRYTKARLLDSVGKPAEAEAALNPPANNAATSEQYIAEFLGACTLESEQPYLWTRLQLTQQIQRFDQGQKRSVSDRQHKMILLLEFLCRCHIGSATVPARAGLG